jgi:tRNA-uridine 2-sulfurtransferase
MGMSVRVFAAMSGGVDSSITAHLLKEAGYDVCGIHLDLAPGPGISPEVEHADLERTCRMINIPLYYLHLEEEFQSRVVDYFCQEYRLGRTPNPCIRCNQSIKFGLLLDKVREMGGEYLATGHYARVEKTGPEYRLLKGIDHYKDQSYFLYVLGQKELAHILFPVGDLRKSAVKQLAADLGFPAASRRESQDICFIPNDDSRAFLSGHLDPQPGEIVDCGGKVLGQHQGLAYYTIGQRQGMGVSAAERLYVIRLEPETNRLVIGPRSQLGKKSLIAYNLRWISGLGPQGTLEVTAKIRYRSPEAPATLEVSEDKAEVRFKEPQNAPAPGQSVVFYQGEMVLGGGIIGETA